MSWNTDRFIPIIVLTALLAPAGCGKKPDAGLPKEAKSVAKAGAPPLSTEVAPASRLREIGPGVLVQADVKQPRSLRVHPDGTVFLVDYLGKQILTLTGAGAVKNRWPFGETDVLGIDVGPDGLLYALESATMKVDAYNTDGKKIRTLDLSPKNGAYNPRGFAVAPDGSFYVVDTGGSQLLHISASGDPIKAFGGSDPFKFAEPSDVAVSATGVVAVADGGNRRIVMLSPKGDFVRAVGIPGTGGIDGIRLDKGDDNSFLASSLDTVWFISKDGDARAVAGKGAGNPFEFQGITAGVAWDAKEKVFYATDASAQVVKVFKLKP